MTGFNHGMTGAVIALTVKVPALAIPLAFLSHFAQDIIPHFGINEKGYLFSRKFNIYLVADFLFAVFLMIILALWFPSHKWLIWACMIAAASPDLMWAYYKLYIDHIKKFKVKMGPIAQFHQSIQRQTLSGAIVEGIWFLAMGAILIELR